MTKPRRVRGLCIAAAMTVWVVTGCGMVPGAADGQPSVSIVSPAGGTSVGLNEELKVDVMAEDPDGPGVVRIDLELDGLVQDTFQAAGPQATVGASMAVTPSEEGPRVLTAIAYREDGTRSEPVSIALSVTGEGAATAEQTGDDDTSAAAEDSPPGAASVRASATRAVDVLAEPGVGCRVIGEVPGGEVMELLRRTRSQTDRYYQTNYLGDDELGWVFGGPLKLQGDDDDLPRQAEAMCQYCGDGTCSAGENETCATCADDCGACNAAAAQPPAPVNQPAVAAGACPAGPGGCCGDGVCQTDESGDWCGDCPAGQAATTGGTGTGGGDGDEPPPVTGGGDWGIQEPVCGDGIVEGNEVCDPPWTTYLAPDGNYFLTCYENCLEQFNSGPGSCGDGWVYAAEEECDPPGAFCAHEYVGGVTIEVYCSADCTCPA